MFSFVRYSSSFICYSFFSV